MRIRRLIRPEEWSPRGIDELEPNADVVARSEVSMCVTAGPGAGKTELLAQRASFLLETGACPYPRRILAISFKRDAAKNLRDRVLKRSGDILGRRLDSFTFDAFAKGVLDQFRAALPPELRPTPEYDILLRELPKVEIEELLLKMKPPSVLGTTRDLLQFASKNFLLDDAPLALFRTEPVTLRKWAAREFWKVLLHGSARSKLSFRMITRLAVDLFRMDARLRRAYRATYTHVFLDEFQDTTHLQYQLMRVLFKDTSAVLTAVGDPRQCIMGWAGALHKIFDRFNEDFSATPKQLYRNHRASDELAPVVRYLADQIGTGISESSQDIQNILPGSGPPADACAAYWFQNEDSEAEWVAKQVETLLSAGTSPREIAILVRMKADEYGRRIIEVLREWGISARIEDRIQDLLTEPIMEACTLALRALASERPRVHWAQFRETIADLRGLHLEDEARWAQVERELETTRSLLRAAHSSPPEDTDSVRQLIAEHIEPLVERIRGRHTQYRQRAFYEQSLRQLSSAIASASWTSCWDDALDEVEGVNAIPILTVHKSKGLEYDAVFFVGLEDGAFWNFKNNHDEEANAFFVALSRARKRVAFTFCKTRVFGGRPKLQTGNEVKALYKLMKQAGVQFFRPSNDR